MIQAPDQINFSSASRAIQRSHPLSTCPHQLGRSLHVALNDFQNSLVSHCSFSFVFGFALDIHSWYRPVPVCLGEAFLVLAHSFLLCSNLL